MAFICAPLLFLRARACCDHIMHSLFTFQMKNGIRQRMEMRMRMGICNEIEPTFSMLLAQIDVFLRNKQLVWVCVANPFGVIVVISLNSFLFLFLISFSFFFCIELCCVFTSFVFILIFNRIMPNWNYIIHWQFNAMIKEQNEMESVKWAGFLVKGNRFTLMFRIKFYME